MHDCPIDHVLNLRYIAQNDYMIDQHMLPTGKELEAAADCLEDVRKWRDENKTHLEDKGILRDLNRILEDDKPLYTSVWTSRP